MKYVYECYWGIFELYSDDNDTFPTIAVYVFGERVGIIIGLSLFTLDMSDKVQTNKLDEALKDMMTDGSEEE